MEPRENGTAEMHADVERGITEDDLEDVLVPLRDTGMQIGRLS